MHDMLQKIFCSPGLWAMIALVFGLPFLHTRCKESTIWMLTDAQMCMHSQGAVYTVLSTDCTYVCIQKRLGCSIEYPGWCVPTICFLNKPSSILWPVQLPL